MITSNNPFGSSNGPQFAPTSSFSFPVPSEHMGSTTPFAFAPQIGRATNPFTVAASSSSAFGNTTPPLGASSTPACGPPLSVEGFWVFVPFGATRIQAFGATNTPDFGCTSTPVFDQTSCTSTSTRVVGQSSSTFNSSLFGGSSPFGAQSSPFGAQSTTFGQNGAFGQKAFPGQQREGSRVAAYVATLEPDAALGTTSGKLGSISAMPIFKDKKSHEELRWEDYHLGDKGNTNPVSTAPPARQPFKLPHFDGTWWRPSSTPDFGSSHSILGIPAFGVPTPFGCPSTPPFRPSCWLGASTSSIGPSTMVGNTTAGMPIPGFAQFASSRAQSVFAPPSSSPAQSVFAPTSSSPAPAFGLPSSRSVPAFAPLSSSPASSLFAPTSSSPAPLFGPPPSSGPAPTFAPTPSSLFNTSTSATAFGFTSATASSATSTPASGAQSTTFTGFGQLFFPDQKCEGSIVAADTKTPGPDASRGDAAEKLESISAMPQYKEKIHEELRWEDYKSRDKGSLFPAPSGGIGFGMPTSQQPSPFTNVPPTFGQTPSSVFNTSTSSNISSPEAPSFTRTGFGTSSTPFSSPVKHTTSPNLSKPSSSSSFGFIGATQFVSSPFELATAPNLSKPPSSSPSPFGQTSSLSFFSPVVTSRPFTSSPSEQATSPNLSAPLCEPTSPSLLSSSATSMFSFDAPAPTSTSTPQRKMFPLEENRRLRMIIRRMFNSERIGRKGIGTSFSWMY